MVSFQCQVIVKLDCTISHKFIRSYIADLEHELCAMLPSPPLGVPVMHKYLRIVRKVESRPPLPLEFGQKNGLNLSENVSLLIFIILKLPAPSPLLKIL